MVYGHIMASPERTLLERLKRYERSSLVGHVIHIHILRSLRLGPFYGPIFMIIVVVQCYFFSFLEWLVPQDQLDYVDDEWELERFSEACSSLRTFWAVADCVVLCEGLCKGEIEGPTIRILATW